LNAPQVILRNLGYRRREIGERATIDRSHPDINDFGLIDWAADFAHQATTHRVHFWMPSYDRVGNQSCTWWCQSNANQSPIGREMPGSCGEFTPFRQRCVAVPLEVVAAGANGEDCRVVEGLLRKDRKVCEPIGAPETDNDFNGLMALLPATRAGTGGEGMLTASDLEQGERL
jgi:hypothetical protein